MVNVKLWVCLFYRPLVEAMIGGERGVMAYPEMSGKGHRSSAGDTPILMAAPVLDFV